MYTSETGRSFAGIFINDQLQGEFVDFKSDCPFYFELEPKWIDSSSTRENQLVGINKIIFRFMTELRDLYTKYSPRNAQNEFQIMKRKLIWYLLKDSGISQKGVTLVDVDRAFAKRFKDNECFYYRYQVQFQF